MAKIETVGVVGAGQMGAGIAQVAMCAGYSTILVDNSEVALKKGSDGIKKRLQRLHEKEKISEKDLEAAESKLTYSSSLQSLESCDLVIEAIIEDFGIKQKLFSDLDAATKKSCILASNTSSISITKIAACTKRPEQVVGAHFMNPVPVMQLVELIRGLQTSEDTYVSIKEFSESLGKTTVLAVDSAGFVVNRILCPMVNEAIFLVQEGVLPVDIDNAMKLGTNQPMGPLELADFVGLDTLLSIMEILQKELGDDKYRPCPLLRNYVDAGWFGRKSGRGFYSYS